MPQPMPPAGAMMTLGGGVQILRSQYLAGMKAESVAAVQTIDILPERNEATIDGNIDDVFAKFPELKACLYNDVKSCPNCGKPCAFSLKACNACGTSLVDTPLSQSENVFTAFLLGVRKAIKGFPYLISLRRETTEALIFDDLLALSPCHFNVISKKYYIPDWRFLLKAPKLGLQLLDTLEGECWAAMEPFLASPEWRKYIFRTEISEADLRKKVIRSFNFPPSQFQMHIQWIVPPLTPFHHFMAETGNHFHEDRAFPVDYVREILALNEPYAVDMNTPIEEIVAHYDTMGVNYKDRWNTFYQQALNSTMELQSWDASSFRYLVDAGKSYEFSIQDGKVVQGAHVADVDSRDLQTKVDGVALRNYGRPYADGGKAAGSYVRTPLQPEFGEKGYGQWPPASGSL